MSKNKDSTLRLSNEALEKLRNDPDSCVEVITCEHHLVLHPFHLRNVGESIKEILNARISKYNKEFKCILLGYNNVKVLGYEAPMSDDTCFMHTTIEAEFFLFKPVVGSVLTGIVNKKSQDHIGCLAHQLFNVSIPKPQDIEDWLGFKAEIGQEIQFKISFIDLDARLPYIKAELISILMDDSGISTSEETTLPSRKKKKKITQSAELEAENKTNADVSKHKKKKKKAKGDEEQTEEVVHKKKKKSKRTEKDENIEDENPNQELIAELKHNYLENLDLLKNVAETENQEQQNAESPKKKKKKKKKSNDTNLLDESLPDLDIAGILSSSTSKEIKENLDLSKTEISFPDDPELDAILNSVPVKKNKQKKRKAEDDTTEGMPAAKKKKKAKRESA